MVTKIETRAATVESADYEADFVDAIWAWLDESETAKRDEPCLICGAPVPATWISDEGFCPICAAE